MILNLGVIDLPYASKDGSTTAQVANILEAKYDVMQTFFDLHQDEIVDSLIESLDGQMDNILNGAPESSNPFADSEAEIEELFKFTYLEQGEIEGKVSGTPTQAAINRRSARFKSGKGKSGRPSFIDTGLYEKSFKAWFE